MCGNIFSVKNWTNISKEIKSFSHFYLDPKQKLSIVVMNKLWIRHCSVLTFSYIQYFIVLTNIWSHLRASLVQIKFNLFRRNYFPFEWMLCVFVNFYLCCYLIKNSFEIAFVLCVSDTIWIHHFGDAFIFILYDGMVRLKLPNEWTFKRNMKIRFNSKNHFFGSLHNSRVY